MKHLIAYAAAAAIAIALYATGTPPLWQMIYTLGIIAIVALTSTRKAATE